MDGLYYYLNAAGGHLSSLGSYLYHLGSPTKEESVDPIQPKVPTVEERLSKAVGMIFEKKEELIEKSLADKKRRFHPITGSCFSQIFDDIVNCGFIVFSIIKVALPSIAKLTVVGAVGTGFGYVGGLLALSVAFVCLRESMQAFKNGDQAKAYRLILMSLSQTAMGVLMILSSTMLYTSLGGVGAFIAANPWLLPVLLLGFYLPLLYEIAKENKSILMGTDPYSSLKFDAIDALLSKDIINWSEMKNLWTNTDLDFDVLLNEFEKDPLEPLSKRMEVLQSKMGASGAVTAFKLFQAMLDENKASTQKHLSDLKGQATLWKTTKYARLAQQIFFIGSFVLSILALKKVEPRLMESLDYVLMFFGMFIPLFADSQWPLLRNVPIVVPKVDVSKLDLS